ncbi:MULTISPECIES: NAD(P)/FAD-dependent oxidoreductase [Bacillaceae]|uniref:NAD(P)/FAD-dependent oxidoreductase n=1 Tax=Bacillaceae TaxID=186817 RepID=UPI001188E60E|nr:NAD(P)/FAD-dependent oxidoreductase [Bacillus sp. S3]QCJ42523.1 FAD-dependent oxidoreductase [Bacillus sp. S3]
MTVAAYSNLFTPGKIGKLEIENRIVKASTGTGLGNRDGTVSERQIRHYKELASGGVGLLIAEYVFIDNDASKTAFCQLGISDNEYIAGLSWLASTIHDQGVKVGIQLAHCGRQRMLGIPPVKAASRIPWPEQYETTGMMPEELTIEEMKQIVKDYGAAAKRAKTAGFDCIEIHAAHGYLITNFLSQLTNKRTDLYGGSLENRMRFLTEVVKSVKEEVGDDYPVILRVNGTDYEPGGFRMEESIQVCKRAEQLGIDALHVSGGDHTTMHYQVSPMSIPKGPNVWAAESIKQEVSIPVIASGSITTPEFAEEILSQGKGDFVSLARPLLADPHFPLKAKEGRPEDIIPCIRCNDGCMERTFFNNLSVRCSVNPNMGREGELPIKVSAAPKNILIIGGGPAGMEAARVSALRGHQVTLYEKGELGGALVAAGAAKFKPDIHNLITYYISQLEKLDINIVHEEATADTVRKGNYEEVIISTGKLPKPFQVKGMDKMTVVHAKDVLSKKTSVGENVVIIGGGLTGTETALFLSNQGRHVTIVEKADSIMNDDLITFKTSYNEMLRKQKVFIYKETEIEEIHDQGALLIHRGGERREIAADTIILAHGYTSNEDFAHSLKNQMNINVHSIGDGKKPGKIYDAIHAGFVTGLYI